MNVTFLVGWAFNVAASANLPALVMLLFWKRHDQAGHHRRDPGRHGLARSAGSCSARRRSSDVYGLPAANAPVPFSQPALVTIPLGFLVLVVVSLLTPRQEDRRRPLLLGDRGRPVIDVRRA